MYEKLESVIRELNPTCHIGAYRDIIIQIVEDEKNKVSDMAELSFAGDITSLTFLQMLYNYHKEIKNDGWLIILPTLHKDGLILRIEWYLKERFVFEKRFQWQEIKTTKCDLLKNFIQDANLVMEEVDNRK